MSQEIQCVKGVNKVLLLLLLINETGILFTRQDKISWAEFTATFVPVQLRYFELGNEILEIDMRR